MKSSGITCTYINRDHYSNCLRELTFNLHPQCNLSEEYFRINDLPRVSTLSKQFVQFAMWERRVANRVPYGSIASRIYVSAMNDPKNEMRV